MTPSAIPAAIILVVSGMCSLIYQMVWFQQLKLVFGTSTAASAAVVAIFMAGLGCGSLFFGRRADADRRPLILYGKIEIGIAITTALSPLLMILVRQIYLGIGGTLTLGIIFGTVLRVLLAVLVLGLPTFLMGGTFPAMSRAMTTDKESGRSILGLLYASNTFGAVLGVIAGTFIMVEMYGLQNTLFIACLMNLLLGGLSILWGRSMPEIAEDNTTDFIPAPEAESAGNAEEVGISLTLTGTAAFFTGAVFFLMEMVWYRMLAPLLGGSTYSFGLILAVALLGIGLGGLMYYFRPSQRPATMAGFALATAFEVLFIAYPLAIGDNIAILAGLTSAWETFGFSGKIMVWTMITVIVVFPASIIAGLQFPMLLSLAGRGRTHVGKQVGLLYALNTLGAVTGSIAGGFGLLPLLSAPGCWRLAAIVTGILSLAFLAGAFRTEKIRLGAIMPIAVCAAGLFLLTATGPTSAWRHSNINVGFGRSDLVNMPLNAIKEWQNIQRRSVIWEADGRESSVALTEANGLAFSINGKCDGNSLEDAPTQIMLGMVSAIAHPAPKTSFVIGLGTGCSAGWLGAIPEMQQVVVAELEPMVLEVASRCASINHDVLTNPKVQVLLGDARELLLTDSRKYDLIVSEPSNPFRAGIASLFTKEFYQAASSRLQPGGLFSQWVQGYQIDVQTMKTVYATLHKVFPFIETWQTSHGDYLLICSHERLRYSRDLIAGRISQEPWKSALWHGWRAVNIEGCFAHYVAGSEFVEQLVKTTNQREHISTDDRMVVEFGLLRSMGQKNIGMMQALQVEAVTNQMHRPLFSDGDIDWAEVRDQNLLFLTLTNNECRSIDEPEKGYLYRVAAHTNFRRENFRGFLQNWSQQQRQPVHPGEFLMLAESFARFGSPETMQMLELIKDRLPGEAWLIEAVYHNEIGSLSEAVVCLEKGLEEFRQHPFPVEPILRRGMELAMNIGLKAPEFAPQLIEMLRKPFLLSALNELRLQAIVGMLPKLAAQEARAICRSFEPHVPWQEEFLTIRRNSYKEFSDPLMFVAETQLKQFLAAEPNRGGSDSFLK